LEKAHARGVNIAFGSDLLGREGQIGELSSGADADMLLLDADPLEDIGVLAEPAKYVQAVVQQGKVMVRHGRLHA
jgi:imidazolonepropionase-like amidohydrolase